MNVRVGNHPVLFSAPQQGQRALVVELLARSQEVAHQPPLVGAAEGLQHFLHSRQESAHGDELPLRIKERPLCVAPVQDAMFRPAAVEGWPQKARSGSAESPKWERSCAPVQAPPSACCIWRTRTEPASCEAAMAAVPSAANLAWTRDAAAREERSISPTKSPRSSSLKVGRRRRRASNFLNAANKDPAVELTFLTTRGFACRLPSCV